jgi:hypothetical protein
MALNFADAAAKKLSENEKPPLAPVGTYRWSINKRPVIRTTADEKWDILEIPVRAVEALDDVDMTDYKGDVNTIFNRVSFLFDKNDEVAFETAMYNARRFFEEHVKCATADDSMLEALNNCVNQQFTGSIAWKQDKNDPEVFHANIARTAPLE